MICDIQSRLEELEDLKSVQLADDLEENLIQELSLDNTKMPAALVYYGATKYQPNETKMYVRQQTLKSVVVLLYCAVADLDTLEDAIVSKVMGYSHTASHTGMEAAGAVTALVVGPVCIRRIEFTTRYLISQQ